MKITTFDPVIVSPAAGDVFKLFEELGFTETHTPVTETSDGNVISHRMKHPDGYHVDVVEVEQEMPRDTTLIRMNVDDFDKAYEILKAHGFKNQHGEETIDKEKSKAATMVSPSGFMIGLVQHFKD